MSVRFLSLKQVLRLHKSQIDAYGGELGLRDEGLLDSACAMPMAAFGGQYLHADIFEMAAAYLFHIVQNHPFLDGNKRAGTATAIIFLKVNKIPMTKINEEQLETLVLDVAQGRIGKKEIAAFFRRSANSPNPGA